ncbi:uncharacterized protein LOC111323926 isoform X3 [Stylophora pistillata]|uniref:uncharacterized protein LOC111323926 isoform X3 n=1 Tax=Stylophora pistillata TaxID=50429 RepID=UPI000C051AB3|nr:uncharacterized protein LOC111323926 isoform X3 [Stylophora pistillata]
MERGEISHDQISASSEYGYVNAAEYSRPNVDYGHGSWSALQLDQKQWLQVDLITYCTQVTGVATLGRASDRFNQWVKSYHLQYSNETDTFENYKVSSPNSTEIFPGNTDNTSVVSHDLNPPIIARYIRFQPLTWESHISMRVELYGCQGNESGNSSFRWTQWSEWSICSKSCDQGVQFRNRTCVSPCNCSESSYQQNRSCISQGCPDSPDSTLEQPSNMITLKTSPSSVAVQWKPYTGRFHLVAYRVLVLRMRAGKSRKIRSTSNMAGELLRNFTVGPNVTSCEIGNLSAFTKYCVRIGAITLESGDESLSDCYYLSTEKEAVTTATPVSPEPVPVVNETAPKITASIRKSQTTILVRWDPKTISGVKGEIIGYDLEFKLIEVNGIPKKDALWRSLIFGCHQFKTEYNLTDLLPFARYKIKMAVFTSEGVGKYSEAVYGVTCACAEFITARSNSHSQLDIITSTLTKVISDLLLDTCGKCEDYTTKLIYSNKSDDGNGLDFPVSKTSFGQSEYSRFVPVITVPGVLVITRKSDLGLVLTQLASGSVLSSWPIAVVTVVTATLAGIVIWCLDSKENSEQFPHQFVKGAGQGFWWSFISMTTVGYGDLCPKSIPGKLFAIVWFLIGLVIFSVFMGTLTSLLTVTTVKKTIGSPQGTDMKTVAVVADSPEKRVAIGSLSGKVTVGKQFPDVEHLVRALNDGAVESILVDMYTPVKRKDLFNGSWYEIFKLLEAEISHGVLLHGQTVSLVEELKKLIIAKNVQTEYLQDASADPEVEEKVLEEEPVTFFEPESPYFRTTMYTTLAALGVCLCCGMLYQALFYKRRRALGNNINSNAVVPKNTASAADLETAVEEFYSSFTSTYKELRRKFKAELIQLEKIKRQGGKNLMLKNFQIFESEA